MLRNECLLWEHSENHKYCVLTAAIEERFNYISVELEKTECSGKWSMYSTSGLVSYTSQTQW